MQSEGNRIGHFDMMFEGGATSFIFKGTTGRSQSVPDDAHRHGAGCQLC